MESSAPLLERGKDRMQARVNLGSLGGSFLMMTKMIGEIMHPITILFSLSCIGHLEPQLDTSKVAGDHGYHGYIQSNKWWTGMRAYCWSPQSTVPVYETDEHQDIPFKTLFQDVPQSKDLISASSTFPESCLLFSLLVVNCWFEPCRRSCEGKKGVWDGTSCHISVGLVHVGIKIRVGQFFVWLHLIYSISKC